MAMAGFQMSALKAWQLRYWAFLIGAASTGSKAELQSILSKHNAAHHSSIPTTQQRIVSVDMGIRNLAFCALEAPPATESSRTRPLKVTAWKRMDLLSATAASPEAQEVIADTEQFGPGSGKSKAKKTKRKKTKTQRDLASAIAKEAFAPSSLSKTAYGVTTELLSLKPSTILIERQRFRSGGASTILEWTIRVNMLESMLWACLETLRASEPGPASPNIQAVSPQRVAQFWTEGLAGISLLPSEDLVMRSSSAARTAGEALGRKGKVDKKAKVAIVKSWVAGESNDVSLTFEGQAAEISEAFKQARGGQVVAGGKLDDLADCLLQAVAWARWEENCISIERLWHNVGGAVGIDESSQATSLQNFDKR